MMAYPGLQWTNFTRVQGASRWSRFWQPVGLRHNGDDTWGDGGIGHTTIAEWPLWKTSDGKLAAVLARDGASELHHQRALANDPLYVVNDSFYSIASTFHYPTVTTNLDTNTTAIFPDGGWAFAYSEPPSSYSVSSNGVFVTFQARPPSGDNNHTFPSDLDFEFRAYGVMVTEGGGGYNGAYRSRGYSRNIFMVDNQSQETSSWQTNAIECYLTHWQVGTNYVYMAGDATTNYHNSAATKVRRHLLFMRNKYVVVYDELSSRSNSTFTLANHVRQQLYNVTNSGWTIVSTNMYSGRSSVTTLVFHAGTTNGQGVKVVPAANTWTNAEFGVFGNDITSHPFLVGYTNNDGFNLYFRNYALYVTNNVPQTNWHFLWAQYPVYTGGTLPTFGRLSDNTIAITNGADFDVVSFGETNALSTLVVNTLNASSNIGGGGEGGGPEGGGGSGNAVHAVQTVTGRIIRP
jgi:hypothetical protein